MGTLSHSYGKPYGYTGNPDTCRWCGEPMPRTRDKEWAGWTEDRKPGDNPWRYTGTVTVGYANNGIFCTLRCGFLWALRKFGVTYEEALAGNPGTLVR